MNKFNCGHNKTKTNLYIEPDGYNRCLKCSREKSRRYYKNHTEQNLQRTKRWRQNNPDKVAEINRRRRQKIKAIKGNIETENYGGLSAVFIRDNGRCAYCGLSLIITGDSRDKHQATIDHVAPMSLGGPDVEWNVILACKPCNSSKQASLLK